MRIKNSGLGSSPREVPHFRDFHLQELNQVLTVKVREKPSSASSREGGKVACLSQQGQISEETILPEPND